MGCIGWSISSNTFDIAEKQFSSGEAKLPNPDPYNFKILDFTRDGKYMIVRVNYPDCKNYEGNKILVFQNVTTEQLHKLKALDPHFSNNPAVLSPIARFEPTDRGWLMAELFVDACKKYKSI